MKHLQCLRKALFPRILARFSKLNNFTKELLFQKKWLLSLSLQLKWPFLEIQSIPRFRIDSRVQNENTESADFLKFSINFRAFYQTYWSDTKLILEAYNGYHSDVFLPKNTVSRILVLVTFDAWGNLVFLLIWQVF